MTVACRVVINLDGDFGKIRQSLIHVDDENTATAGVAVHDGPFELGHGAVGGQDAEVIREGHGSAGLDFVDAVDGEVPAIKGDVLGGALHGHVVDDIAIQSTIWSVCEVRKPVQIEVGCFNLLDVAVG